jgi:hypothetical protein
MSKVAIVIKNANGVSPVEWNEVSLLLTAELQGTVIDVSNP